MSKPKNAILHESPEFVEFWTIWKPIRNANDGRLDAKDGFNKMIAAGADPRDIIDGARWRARNPPEFRPHAKTWINKGAWIDDCEREREFQARQSESPKVVNMQAARPAGKSAFLREYEKQG